MDQNPDRRHFLDFLDQQGREDHANELGPDLDQTPAVSEPTGSVFKEIKEKMIFLQLRLSETENELDLTRQALSKSRSEARDQIESLKHDCAEQIRRQREDFESVIQRQMSFSKKVLEEKAALAKKVDELIHSANQREHQLTTQITDLKEQEQTRVQKVKMTIKAAEKVRAERQMEEMRAAIKRDTIRALEPEVQRLIDSHNEERRRIADQHEQALRQQNEAHRDDLRKLRELESEQNRRLELEQQLKFQASRQQELQEEYQRIFNERKEEKLAFEQALKRMRQRLEDKQDKGVCDSVHESQFDAGFWNFDGEERQ